MKNQKEISQVEQHVVLIASGYEFECQCGVLNKVSSIPTGNLGEDGPDGSVVTCKSCGADLVVDDFSHAIG